MYQAHQTEWFVLGFVGCVGLLAALGAVAHFGKVKLPNYVFIPPIGMAILLMLAMSWLRVSDDEHLRTEMRDFNPLVLSNVLMCAGAVWRPLAETNEIIPLFSQLQRVAVVPAHHSSPTSPVIIEFWTHGQKYRYQVARDSQRADEYWVLETERAGESGREIGRIESPELGLVLEALARGKAPKQP